MSNVDPNLEGLSPGGNGQARDAMRTSKNASATAGPIQPIFWWLAAVDNRVMADPDCSADWRRYAILGAAVLMTGLLATAYATVVVYFYYLRDVWVAMTCGVAWGCIIVICDRLMLASLVKGPDTGGGALALMAIPRFFLALLIATAISIPAELVIFGRQIESTLAAQHQEAIVAERRLLDERYTEIPRIDSLTRALNGEVASADSAASAQFAKALCEADGTCGSGTSGDGFRYQEKLSRYSVLKTEADRARATNEVRLRALRIRRDSLEQEKARDLDTFRSVTDAADDLLSRLTALARLEQDPKYGRTVLIAAWVIRLLAILIEILPLGTKLTSRRGPYEAAYLAVHDGQRALWDARREAAVHRASVERDRLKMIADGVRRTAESMVDRATSDALESEEAQEAMRDLQRQILNESVRVARRAAARVFAEDDLERDIAVAARARRRHHDERVVDAEVRRADILDDLASAEAEVDDVLREQDHAVSNWHRREWPDANITAAD